MRVVGSGDIVSRPLALSSSGCGLLGNWSYGERKFAAYEMRMSYVHPGELLGMVSWRIHFVF